jgi:hypothetical protein
MLLGIEFFLFEFAYEWIPAQVKSSILIIINDPSGKKRENGDLGHRLLFGCREKAQHEIAIC